jgi:exonuclease SbcC
MRPHSLRLTAFGPFAGTVEVDLDALAASGLFLLHGPTGAGKTTLLDGLGFALFGRVPGVRNAAKRLRSDHAPAGTRTEVQLEVTLGDRRMRITRSPQQERAKARGTGSTTEQASVLLEELVGDAWICVSTRVGEADAEIADLVGMSAEQFFQVVLLPQGDFAQFLRASSADRAEVLKKLFATERFADVETWLAARRRQADQACAAARGSLSRMAARVAEVAEAEVPETDELSWASNLLVQCAAADAAAAEVVAVATSARDTRRATADAATRLASCQQRKRSALLRQDELQADLPVRLALQAEVDAATRAAQVAPLLGQVTQRQRARDDALGAVVVARAALVDVGIDDELDAGALSGFVEAGQERAGRLESLRAVDVARRESVAEKLAAQDELADVLAARADAELSLEQLPAHRSGAEALLERARAAAARLPGLAAERERLDALRPDLVQLAQVRDRVLSLTEEHLSARETALSLAEKASDLRTANVSSMIARLAFALEDECPCPVCGSAVHPDKSLLTDEGISSEDEDRARIAADRAQDVVADVGARLAADQARLADLESRVGALTLDALDDQLASLDLDVIAVSAEAQQEPMAQELVTGFGAQQSELEKAVVASSERADACTKRMAKADGQIAAAEAELAKVLGPATDLDAAVAELATQLAAARTCLVAATDLAQAQVELTAAQVAAQESSALAGFLATEDAAVAVRDSGWHDDAAARLRSAADEAAAINELLHDPELDVDLEVAAPVAAASADLEVAEAELTRAVGAHAQITQRREALERLLPELTAELVALEPLEASAREVRGLADLCAGQGANGLKMTLTSFVLAARLEEVAAAASVRLLRMTQGRYSLVHTDGAASKGARSGLGLLARDGWSGQDRDTSTLSGGETFLASLALALGLADVVTAEAGGSRIGALFVDEGFGTLDEETLDEVMDVLDGLREGGRIVGLVSHVSELRQRIPAQVHVTKTRAGSSLTLVGC